MAPTGEAYHVDWVFSSNANVHVARDQQCFGSFTEFSTYILHGLAFGSDAEKIKVTGIGQVTLPVGTDRNRGSESYQGKIVLKNVLHAPSVQYNILGGPIMDEYSVRVGVGDSKLQDPNTGACVAIPDYTNFCG